MSQILIRSLMVGPVMTNCYLIMNQETKDMIVIDPGDDAVNIQNKIEDMGGNPVAILLTHGHFDHIGAVDVLRRLYNQIRVYAYGDESQLLADPEQNHSVYNGAPLACQADQLLQDDEKIALAGFVIRVLHTPGHTHGSCCYLFPDEALLFSGDTLFEESVGRTDLPTGSMSEMRSSIARLMSELPEETEVYPGHGDDTTIAHEKRYNPFA